MKYPLKIASVSDIHLGHRNTSTAHIVSNLIEYLCNDRVFSTLDMLLIPGDVCDDIVSMRSEDSAHINRWIYHVVMLSIKHNVKVRVLEGTPSHDRQQSKHFANCVDYISQNGGPQADLKYVRELSVEWISDFDMHVLYIPDDWRHDNRQTLQEVDDVLAHKGIERVDIALMHGLFEHQAPPLARPGSTHANDEYLRRVKHLIFVGHHHTHSVDRRIIAQGSFDRLRHGEQEAKGYVLVDIYGEDHWTAVFRENKSAKRYDTLDVYSPDAQVALALIGKQIKGLLEDAHVRLKFHPGSVGKSILPEMKSLYPSYHWSELSVQVDGDKNQPLTIQPVHYQPTILNESTLLSLAKQRALDKGCSEADAIKMCAIISEAL